MIGDLDEDIDGVLSASGSFFVLRREQIDVLALDVLISLISLVWLCSQRTRLDGWCVYSSFW